MRITAVSAFCLAGAFVANADTALWTNNVDATAYWTNTTFWVDENGDNLVEPPTNHTHDVTFAALDSYKYQEIRWTTPPWQGTLAIQAFGMLSLTEQFAAVAQYSHRTINIYNDDWNSHYREYPVAVTVDDPDGFKGFWKTRNTNVGFILPATDGKSPILSNVSVERRVYFDVPTADTTAYLESAYGRGVLEKRGNGELHVMATGGADNTAYVKAGTLTLEGRPGNTEADELPVPGAYMHFDASLTNAMKTYLGEDGRTYVTNWPDISGNGKYAYFDAAWKGTYSYLTTNTCAPFLNTTFVKGKTVMDFGRSSWSQDESLGPVGCCLRISEEKSNIREVFYVGQYVDAGDYCVIPGAYNAYSFHRTRNALVANYDSTLPVRRGDILYDGLPGQNSSGFSPTEFSVVAVGTSANVAIGAMVCDRMYMNRTGGAKLGEMILYTNALTHVQRVQISNYLLRKWKGTDAADIGAAMVVSSTGAAIGVPEGRTANVAEIGVFGDGMVKKGGGTLEVGNVAAYKGAARPTLDVQEGSVVFRALGTATDAPAADPYLWLDATRKDSFVFTNKTDDTASEKYIAEWHDRRPDQTAVYAKLPVGTWDYRDGLFPTRIEDVVGDKAVVDFGTPGYRAIQSQGGAWSDGEPSFLNLNVGNVTKSRVSFVVMRFTSPDVGRNIFGSSSIHMYRSTTSTLLSKSYGGYVCYGALWTVNGVPVDPVFDDSGNFATGDWIVASVSTVGPASINLIGGKDRIAQGVRWGGQQVAEQLVYDRVLTPEERRRTIAYLMKKWKDEDASGAGPIRLAAMRFADGTPAVVDSVAGTTVEVGAVSGGDGSFVKKGAGTAAVSLNDMNDIDSLSVEEGTLNADLSFYDDSAFHIDASAVDTLSYYVTEDGARTNVTSVTDVRGNGMVANAWINDPNVVDGVNRAVSYTNPVWRMIVRADGVARPAFDFGRKSGYWSNHYPSSSAFRLSKSLSNILDAHVVFSDNDDNDRAVFFGDSSAYHYMRGGDVLFDRRYAAETVTNGYIAIDGSQVGPWSIFPEGFHVVSCAPTGKTTVGAIAGERNIECGGCYVSEMICFTNNLGTARRKYLQDMLMHKWIGREKPVWPVALSSMDVAVGAVLNITGEPKRISVARVAGGGTVTGADLCGVSEIEVACTGGNTFPATFSGDVSFASDATVALVGETDTLVSGGTYPLMNAGNVIAGEVEWTVTGIPVRRNRKVFVSGGTLMITLVPSGTAVTFR